VVELVLRLVFSLLVVLGLLLLLARLAQRRFRGGNGALIRVVARQPLSRSSAIAVVNVADRILVVGTTENGISLLTELDADSLEVEPLELAGTTTPVPAQTPQSGPLGGSILSPQTWKQAMMAAQRGHRTPGDNFVEP
jgi:flagellar protein FliO/FliZ